MKIFDYFVKENINFTVVATDKSKEVYMRLNFEKKNAECTLLLRITNIPTIILPYWTAET
jgi:hypothetical protein